jgi:hypothetical protein
MSSRTQRTRRSKRALDADVWPRPFKKALEQNPNDLTTMRHYAHFLPLSDRENTEPLLKKALERAPCDGQSLRRYAHLLSHHGQHDEAKTDNLSLTKAHNTS